MGQEGQRGRKEGQGSLKIMGKAGVKYQGEDIMGGSVRQVEMPEERFALVSLIK